MRGETKDLNREIENRKKNEMLELISTISEMKYTLDHSAEIENGRIFNLKSIGKRCKKLE